MSSYPPPRPTLRPPPIPAAATEKKSVGSGKGDHGTKSQVLSKLDLRTSKKPTKGRPPVHSNSMMDPEATRPEFDPFTDQFFSQPSSLHPVEIELQDEDLELVPALSQSNRRAMHASLGMLGVSAVVLLGFFFYSRVLMPTPVELSAAGVTAPMPIAPLAPTTPMEAAPAQPAPNAMPAGELAAAQAPQAPVAAAAAAPLVMAMAAPAIAAPSQELGLVEPSQHSAAHTRSNAVPSSGAKSTPAAHGSDALVKQAYQSLNRGNAREAVTHARNALASAPTRADAWLVLGSAYSSLGDRASAQSAYHNCADRAQGAAVATCRQLARN